MRILLPLIVLLFTATASSVNAEPEEQIRAYHCDHAAVHKAGSAPCYPTDDPKWGTIALFAEPMKNPTRIPDPGDGVPVTVLRSKMVFGTKWLHVETEDGKKGWITAQFVKATTK